MPPDASKWRRALAQGIGAAEPILGAVEASVEATAPIRGAVSMAQSPLPPEIAAGLGALPAPLRLPGMFDPNQAVNPRYRTLREGGLDPVSAATGAWQTAVKAGEIPLGSQMLAEALTDPLELGPGGWAASGARAAARAATRGAAGAVPRMLRPGRVKTPPTRSALVDAARQQRGQVPGTGRTSDYEARRLQVEREPPLAPSPERRIRPGLPEVQQRPAVSAIARALAMEGTTPSPAAAPSPGVTPSPGAAPSPAAAPSPTPAFSTPNTVNPPPVAKDLLGAEPVTPGPRRITGIGSIDDFTNSFLDTINQTMKATKRGRWVQESFANNFNWVPYNSIVDPIKGEANRLRRTTKSRAAEIAARMRSSIDEVFEIDDSGHITNSALANIDDQLGNLSPTVADVAARLPRYWLALTRAQRTAMTQLRNELAPWRELIEESGYPVYDRPDIIQTASADSGFYIPRGAVTTEARRLQDPLIRLSAQPGSAPFDQPSKYASQTKGIAEGEAYPSFYEAIHRHIVKAGNAATDNVQNTYLKSVKDPVTNELVGISQAARVDPDLRIRINRYKRRVIQITGTIKLQRARLMGAQKQAEKRERESVKGRTRLEREKARLEKKRGDATEEGYINDGEGSPPSSGEIDTSLIAEGKEARISLRETISSTRRDLTDIIKDLREYSREIGENTEMIRSTGKALSRKQQDLMQLDNEITKTIDALEPTLAVELTTAEGLTEKSLRRILKPLEKEVKNLTNRRNKMSKEVDSLSRDVDTLIENNVFFKDMDKAKRKELIETRRTMRNLNYYEKEFRASQRVLRVLTQEEHRLQRAARDINVNVDKRMETLKDSGKRLEEAQNDYNDLNATWQAALRKSRKPETGKATITHPRLTGYHFPTAVADSANSMIRDIGDPIGKGASLLRTVAAFNQFYRGLVATLDNSGLGIQGSLGMYGDPKAYRAALMINLRAWGNPKVLGEYFIWFNEMTSKVGRLSTSEWANDGLQIGGQATEMELTGIVTRIPVVGRAVQAANRAYGYFGDALRLAWADDELTRLLAQGRNLDEIKASGDLKRLTASINAATGYSTRRFGGQAGEQFLFAPRFLQSRLETIANAAKLGTLDGRIARRSLLRMIGTGILLTYSINWLQGRETDHRLVIKSGGKWHKNSNFMRIRIAGRDFSMFGTWDSLLGMFIATATGQPQNALRGMSSGAVSIGWDLLSGKDFIGQETSRPWVDPWTFGKYTARTMSPFAFEELPEAVTEVGRGIRDIGRPSEMVTKILLGIPDKDRDVVGGVAGVARGLTLAAGEAVGAKSAPTSFTDTANDVAREMGLIVPATGGLRYVGGYRDLEEYQKDDIDRDPRVIEVKRNRPNNEYYDAMDRIQARHDDELVRLLSIQSQLESRDLLDKWFSLENKLQNEKQGVREAFEISFTEGESQSAQDLSGWYNLFNFLDPPGQLAKKRHLFIQSLGGMDSSRAQYVLRNIYRSEVPYAIRKHFTGSHAVFRKQSEKARVAHRKLVQMARQE